MKNETVTITTNIGKEAVEELRKRVEASERKKGLMGQIITIALLKYFQEKEQEEIAKRALERLKKGYHMGKNLIKHRDELYDRK